MSVSSRPGDHALFQVSVEPGHGVGHGAVDDVSDHDPDFSPPSLAATKTLVSSR